MRRRVLLMGGHSKTKSLARSLISKGYDVCAVNEAPEVARDLANVEGLEVVCGDPTEAYVLDQAGASTCDVVVALSNSDAQNLVACEMCELHFGVPKSVSVVSDSRKVEFFRKMGVDAPVSVAGMVSAVIEQQALSGELTSTIPLEEGRVDIIETTLAANSPANGKTVAELDVPDNVVLGCVLRGTETIVPNGSTRLLAGDRLVVIKGNTAAADKDAR